MKKILSIIMGIILLCGVSFGLVYGITNFNKLNVNGNSGNNQQQTDSNVELVNKYKKEIESLTAQKNNLEKQVEELTASDEDNSQKINNLNKQIEELNIQIANYDKISATISNATIELQESYYSLFVPSYWNGEFQYYSQFRLGEKRPYTGDGVEYEISNSFKFLETADTVSNFCENLIFWRCEAYYVSIGNVATRLDNTAEQILFKTGSVPTLKVNFNGESSNLDTILANIVLNQNYYFKLDFEYTLEDNIINSSTIILNIDIRNDWIT